MRTFLSFLVRAVCAAATGYLLVMYRNEMVQWLTIAVGALFFVSGLFSVIAYYAEKRKAMHWERTTRQAERPANPAADDVGRKTRTSMHGGTF